jgi:copper homeostasis protein (lipoprotein)
MKIFKLFIAAMVLPFAFSSCNQSENNAGELTDKPDMHNSMIALDWDGKYSGTTPCADCEGISTSVTLNQDLTYLLEMKYLGKSDKIFRFSGGFVWNENGSTVILQGIENGPTMYFVGENVLIQLDMDGNRITGELAGAYLLHKEEAKSNSSEWKLESLYGISIDSEIEISLINDSENRRISGFAGCNNFTGSYELMGNNKVKLLPVAATKKACMDEKVSNLEMEFLQMLQKVNQYALNGNQLILQGEAGEELAHFSAR